MLPMQSELPKPRPARDAPESFLEFMVDNWFFIGATILVVVIYVAYLKLLRNRKNKEE